MRRPLLGLSVLGLLAGCASNMTGGNLYTSNIVFLPPSSAHTVYVETRNTSDNQSVTLQDVASRLNAKGYQLVSDPAQAQYVVQANTLYCNTEKQAITMETMVTGGYGGSLGGTIGAIGGAVGSIGSMAGMANPMIGMAAGGISAVTGAAGSVVDSVGGLFGSNTPEQEVTYACVTDLQITEQIGTASSPAGTSKVYQTRLVAGAHQKKINIKEATPVIEAKLVNGITGNF
jgi:hypothetical protein